MAAIFEQDRHEQLGNLASSVAVPPRPIGRRRLKPKEAGKSFLFTFVVVVVLAAFLSPLVLSLIHI